MVLEHPEVVVEDDWVVLAVALHGLGVVGALSVFLAGGEDGVDVVPERVGHRVGEAGHVNDGVDGEGRLVVSTRGRLVAVRNLLFRRRLIKQVPLVANLLGGEGDERQDRLRMLDRPSRCGSRDRDRDRLRCGRRFSGLRLPSFVSLARRLGQLWSNLQVEPNRHDPVSRYWKQIPLIGRAQAPRARARRARWAGCRLAATKKSPESTRYFFNHLLLAIV